MKVHGLSRWEGDARGRAVQGVAGELTALFDALKPSVCGLGRREGGTVCGQRSEHLRSSVQMCTNVSLKVRLLVCAE